MDTLNNKVHRSTCPLSDKVTTDRLWRLGNSSHFCLKHGPDRWFDSVKNCRRIFITVGIGGGSSVRVEP
jgi:hypothetical protein